MTFDKYGFRLYRRIGFHSALNIRSYSYCYI